MVPAGTAPSVIEDAERLAAIERAIGDELRGGDERSAVFKRHPRFGHIRTVSR